MQFKKGCNIQNALAFFEKALIPLHIKYNNGYFIRKNEPAKTLIRFKKLQIMLISTFVRNLIKSLD